MPWPSLGNHFSLVGNSAVRLKPTRALRIGAVLLGASLLTPAARYTIVAQTSNAPAVRMLRDFKLYQSVWPADFNGDGVTDLVSNSLATVTGGVTSGGHVQVSIGRGDGTFNAPVESSFRGAVAGSGDFNGDQRIDVIAIATGGSLVLLPGTGGAALGAPVTVGPIAEAFALSADLNADGKRDSTAETAELAEN
jgi:hypothetical protein